jgi:hypothetical protein
LLYDVHCILAQIEGEEEEEEEEEKKVLHKRRIICLV